MWPQSITVSNRSKPNKTRRKTSWIPYQISYRLSCYSAEYNWTHWTASWVFVGCHFALLLDESWQPGTECPPSLWSHRASPGYRNLWSPSLDELFHLLPEEFQQRLWVAKEIWNREKINVTLGCLSEHQMLGSNATEEARAVVDPDLELGGNPVFCRLPCRLFYHLWFFLFIPKITGGGRGAGLPGPSPRSASEEAPIKHSRS